MPTKTKTKAKPKRRARDNGKPLIIVESPAKIRTLTSLLKGEYDIVASMGHVRDLPKTKFGVEVDDGFTPTYQIIPDRRSTLKNISKQVKTHGQVYLASDPDREGEAIAWHVVEALSLTGALRIQFNEITKSAVLHALANPGEIDMKRVHAQQARRILDRLVGYRLSPILWKKVRRNLSAGRVQSVALRMVCDRERQIEAFVPKEHWPVRAHLAKEDTDEDFFASLLSRDGKRFTPSNKEEASECVAAVRQEPFIVAKVEKKRQKRNARPPFITSTMQQEASRRLGFNVRRTMRVAQSLYEGVSIPGEGEVGLITYMRTDSQRIAKEAAEEARAYIQERYGAEYVPAKPNAYRSRKGAQDAHEAIRPTGVRRAPEDLKECLSPEQFRLYRLIWQRLVASQMTPAQLDVVTADIHNGAYLFRAQGSVVVFPGHTAVYAEAKNENEEKKGNGGLLPPLSEGERLALLDVETEQKFTQPPPRYTEATLVKALEEQGIGRPSTYAAIISTIRDRNYAESVDKRFHPTLLGFAVTDLLVKHFPDIMDVAFTAGVEEKLDSVEQGKSKWDGLLLEFYHPFAEALNRAEETAERVKLPVQETDEICPNCGKKMVIREGKYGKFLGCSGFPECKTISRMPHTRTGVACPEKECKGELVKRVTRKRKRVFYGCSEYPNCKFAIWNKPISDPCPKCGHIVVEKQRKGQKVIRECASDDCDYREEWTAESPNGENQSQE